MHSYVSQLCSDGFPSAAWPPPFLLPLSPFYNLVCDLWTDRHHAAIQGKIDGIISVTCLTETSHVYLAYSLKFVSPS